MKHCHVQGESVNYLIWTSLIESHILYIRLNYACMRVFSVDICVGVWTYDGSENWKNVQNSEYQLKLRVISVDSENFIWIDNVEMDPYMQCNIKSFDGLDSCHAPISAYCCRFYSTLLSTVKIWKTINRTCDTDCTHYLTNKQSKRIGKEVQTTFVFELHFHF